MSGSFREAWVSPSEIPGKGIRPGSGIPGILCGIVIIPSIFSCTPSLYTVYDSLYDLWRGCISGLLIVRDIRFTCMRSAKNG